MHLSLHMPRNPMASVSRTAVVAVAVAAIPGTATASPVVSKPVSARPVARSVQAPTATVVRPGHIHLAGDETLRQAAPVIHVADELYTFWNTGDAADLERSDSLRFHDNTLLPGRPQGRNGILAASRTFRTAVPDLRCRVVNLYITGDTFTAQLIFSGHFSGTLDGHQGTGQRIRFNAIDIQHIGRGGRIVEDWHLEDNLTFLEQAGVLSAP